MRSSAGEHFIALDHIRALAAFMVFTWHFTHAANGFPVPFDYVPALPPFAILDEGHTGVALFMALSGYLFAKLLDGKSINYAAFFWNRTLRLVPLLVVALGLFGIKKLITGESLIDYGYLLLKGLILPTLPNGAWSITVEFHFYALLPLLLWLLRQSKLLPLLVVAAALALRVYLYRTNGEVQQAAYWTIIGRIDQFALGMLLFHFRQYVAGRHWLIAAIVTAFTLFYGWFDASGGFYLNPRYPSSSPLWIILPTVEGLAYAAAIAWYDNSCAPSRTGVSKFVGLLGEYSYSIYLLHVFVVFSAARFIHRYVMDLSNFYVACAWALVCFMLMLPIGYLSYRFIESPFLKLRKRYILPSALQRVD